jgi:hypothetical protein
MMTQSHPLACKFPSGEYLEQSFIARLLTGVVRFVTIVDAGRFPGAARLLGITPSGVSCAGSRPREELGVHLFNQRRRGLS